MQNLPSVLSGAWPLLMVAACRTSAPAQVDGSSGQPVTLTTASAPAPDTLKARMREHDVHGAAMRDAVARADFEAARREARFLAELRVEGVVDPTWRKQLEAMHGAAARLAEAADLPQASVRLAAVARTCGDCHATLGGPRPPARGRRTA